MFRRIFAVSLVLLFAAVIGAYFHFNRSPKVVSAAEAEFCDEHQLPESDCPFCHNALVQKIGMCVEHKVPEALCWKCNPKILASFKHQRDWCAEHDAPESLCPICKPDVAMRFRKLISAASQPAQGTDQPGTQTLSGAADVRNSREPSALCMNDQRAIHLHSADAAERAGIEWTAAESAPAAQEITMPVQIQYDARRYARVSPRSAGLITRVHKDLGQPVRVGEPLATLESSELTDLTADYLQAAEAVELWEKSVVRKQSLAQSGLTAERDLIETQAKLSETRITMSQARQKLLGLGLNRADIDLLRTSRESIPAFRVVSPIDGKLVERQAVSGETAEAGKPLFAVADISRVWAILQASEENAGDLKIGLKATISVAALPGRFSGQVSWISTQVDPQTRALSARVELDNPQEVLRANMVGIATIDLSSNARAVCIPKAAVQWDGCCNLVFVRASETEYQPRKVTLRESGRDRYAVASGLNIGEPVVTQGSFLLKTELLKSKIGAGCCGHD